MVSEEQIKEKAKVIVNTIDRLCSAGGYGPEHAVDYVVGLLRGEAKARLEELEACAALCFKRMPEKGLEKAHSDPGLAYELGRIDQAQADAAAIRARGEEPRNRNA